MLTFWNGNIYIMNIYLLKIFFRLGVWNVHIIVKHVLKKIPNIVNHAQKIQTEN